MAAIDEEPAVLRAWASGRAHAIARNAERGAGLPGRGCRVRRVQVIVDPNSLAAALDGLGALGIAGANLTIPHKEAALTLMSAVTPEAERIGAVNTVGFDGARRVGTNTDGPGFLAALRDAGSRTRRAAGRGPGSGRVGASGRAFPRGGRRERSDREPDTRPSGGAPRARCQPGPRVAAPRVVRNRERGSRCRGAGRCS